MEVVLALSVWLYFSLFMEFLAGVWVFYILITLLVPLLSILSSGWLKKLVFWIVFLRYLFYCLKFLVFAWIYRISLCHLSPHFNCNLALFDIRCDFIPDKIRPSDVGLEQEAQYGRVGSGSMHQSNGNHPSLPPIKYMHLHECDSFSVSIWL